MGAMTPSWATWLIHMCHDSFICDMAPSYITWLLDMWHDSLMCDMTLSYGTRLLHMWHDFFIHDTAHSYVTWLLHMWYDSLTCDMAHPYVGWLHHMWYVIYMTWPLDMTHPYVTLRIYTWHDFSMCVATLTCVTRLLRVWHDSNISSHVTWIMNTWLIHMRLDFFICDMTALLPWFVTWLHYIWYDPIVVCHYSFICASTHWYVTCRSDMTHLKGGLYTHGHARRLIL